MIPEWPGYHYHPGLFSFCSIFIQMITFVFDDTPWSECVPYKPHVEN